MTDGSLKKLSSALLLFRRKEGLTDRYISVFWLHYWSGNAIQNKPKQVGGHDGQSGDGHVTGFSCCRPTLHNDLVVKVGSRDLERRLRKVRICSSRMLSYHDVAFVVNT